MRRVCSIIVLFSSITAALAGGQIIVNTPSEIVIEYHISRLDTFKIQWQQQELTLLRIPDTRLTTAPGKPAVPYWETRVAIGGPIPPVLQVVVNDQAQMKGIVPLPAYYSPLKENAPEALYFDPTIYQRSQFYPENWVTISEPYVFRGVWVVRLRVYPVRFEPVSQEATIARTLQIRLTLNQKKEQSFSVPKASIDNMKNDPILQSNIINFTPSATIVADAPAWVKRTAVNYDFTTGNWFKIPVEKEGVYRITGKFLKENGINIRQVQVETIQMFNYGGWRLPWSVNKPRPSDLNEIAIEVLDKNGDGLLDESDEILFYGRGVLGWRYDSTAGKWVSYLHPYSTKNYYLLTFNATTGKRIQQRASAMDPTAVNLTQFTDRLRFEEDHYNILGTGLDWYWLRLEGIEDVKELSFQLPQNAVEGPLKFYIVFKGENGFIYGDNDPYRDSVTVRVNNTTIIRNVTYYRTEKKGLIYQASTLAPFRGGTNTLQIHMIGNFDRSKLLLDYFTVQFNRALIAEDDYLKFNVTFQGQPLRYEIRGFSNSDNVIWDITDFANVQSITPIANGTTVLFDDKANAGTVREYLVFNKSFIKEVTEIAPVSNRPNLRDPARRGQFIIIVPEAFYEIAGELETLRESDPVSPLETERVILEDIFREFSSGVLDVTAIRDFLMYAYYNWAVPPEYVLLFGDGSYDYRHIELKDYINWIPTYQIEDVNEIFSRETDHFYTAFGNTAGNNRILDPWLAIGRFPVNSLEQARTYLEKLKNYPQYFLEYPDYNGWQITLTFAADDEFGPPGNNNEWYHLRDTEDLIKRYVKPLQKFSIRKIYLTDYEAAPGGIGRVKPEATEDLLNQINQGTLIVNYFGHGDPQTWAHEWLLVRSRDLVRFHNAGRLPFYVAATCDWGKFDDPNDPSMAEEMFWGNNYGGIAILSATRPVFASANAAFVKSFFYYLFNNVNGNLPSVRLGDALVASLGGGSNDQKFRFLGDPTMHLVDPDFRLRVTRIEPDTLKALSVVTIRAQVVDFNNNPYPNFNGQAVVWINDATIDRITKNKIIRYTYTGGTIYKGKVRVTNGELVVQFIVPRSIQYKLEASGEVHIYAWDDAGKTAVGYYNQLLITGSTDGIDDTQGPEIDVTFLEQPEFTNGDYVSRQPTLVVHLYDENGINLTGETGHKIELVINNRIRKDVTSFFVYKENDFREGSLTYTLPALPPGNYQIKIRAWDNLNNPSEAEIMFKTAPVAALVLDEVANFPNPFQKDTYFTFQFQSPSGNGEVRINIYTLTGRLVRRIETMAYPGFNKIYWDGTDADGVPLANGVYLYKISVTDGEKRKEKIEKLVILR